MSKVMVLAELKPEEEFFEAVLDDLHGLMPGTRSFNGCFHATLSVSAKRAEILVQHIWDSIGAVNDYLTWRAERGDLMRISEMLAEEPLYRTYQLDWDDSKTLAAGGSGAEVLTGT